MTARIVLIIDNAWQHRDPPGRDEPSPVLAQVSDGAVRLTVYGTDDTMVIPAADWLALVAFVAGQTPTAKLPPQNWTTELPAPSKTKRHHTPETRQRLREAAQRRMALPGERERMSEIARARHRAAQEVAATPAESFRNGDAAGA